MAKFMADTAVKNTIENKGQKPAGKIQRTCQTALVGPERTARQHGYTKVRRSKISVAAWNE
jgi:hypothetical protein